MEIDISAIETKANFSSGHGGGGSKNWNNELVDQLLTQLKEKSEPGTVRSIPVKWIYENLRTDYEEDNDNFLVGHVGWAFRKKFVDRAKALGINADIHQSMCKNKTTIGSIEIKFLD